MPFADNIGDYVIVTPVKDEEMFLERTIRSVLSQTVPPSRWVIVDDGSCDRTPDIVRVYADRVDWISAVRIERDRERRLGSAESRAFAVGYELIRKQPHSFVVKLDGDLLLPDDYFDQMLCRFRENGRLGIASGVYLEKKNGEWREIAMPAYHATGAAKMVRTECFAAIGGFSTSPGWDTADEIKAWSKGWETMHFPELQIYHLKPEGSAQGASQTGRLHGEVYYACGGGKLFFLLKVLQRLLIGKPFVLGGISLLYGYLHAAVTRRPKLVTPQEAALYRKVLNQRILRRTSSGTFCPAGTNSLPGKA
jgi:glycosyltransferase involved in cell wall biosynthesis